MCGIVGYIGYQNAVPILMNGLRRLEYRGYDSAGVAFTENGGVAVHKRVGKLSHLEEALKGNHFNSSIGIGHTRGATHGEPTEINAHPHTDSTGGLALVHNGIIENHDILKKRLTAEGHHFQTETDTETLCHLFEAYLKKGYPLAEAVRLGLSEVEGTYGIVVLHHDFPNMLIAARNGSPLVVGLGNKEYFVASDATPLVAQTCCKVSYLDDGEMAVITREGMDVKNIANETVHKPVVLLDGNLDRIEKDGYPHFMLKEIMQQPETLVDTLRGRLLPEEGTAKLGGIGKDFESLLYARRVVITACGTSWHAGLIGEYLLEELVGIPVEVEYASEFRYRNPILGSDSVVIAISQSGETADTLAAIREAKSKGSKVYGICNVVGSTIARETDAGIYLHAGPEIGVASTKAFTSQVTVLALISLLLGRKRALSLDKGREIVRELQSIPEKVKKVLSRKKLIQAIAREFEDCQNALYLGRGYNFPVALEGALKLKEISYIHAEGYPAAEMKHGPIALIDEHMPVVVIATNDAVYDKVISSIQEVRARKGRVIAVATEGNKEIQELADRVIEVPETLDILNPLINSIPLQLLAYYVAVARDCDVDQPRNLAKSVTVE